MDITEVRVSLRDDQKLKAFVSITLDDCFVIRGLKIIEGADGMFVAMPSRQSIMTTRGNSRSYRLSRIYTCS